MQHAVATDPDLLNGYAYGKFLAGDFQGCLDMNRKAAALGSAAGHYWIGILALDHQCGDRKAAVRSLEIAAEDGLTDAKVRLAVHLLEDRNNPASLERAVHLLEQAVKVENPTALSLLATCRRYGVGCAVDPAETSTLLHRAVQANAVGAAEALAAWEAEQRLTLTTSATTNTLPLQSDLTSRAVVVPEPDAEAATGDAYVKFLAGDLKGSLKLNQKAAALGSAAGHYWIGILALDHQFGDRKAAVRSLEIAAEDGLLDAKVRLAVHLLDERRKPASLRRAVSLLEEAVEAENPTALGLLATCRRYGIGCAVDPVATGALLRRAISANTHGASEALASWEAEQLVASTMRSTQETTPELPASAMHDVSLAKAESPVEADAETLTGDAYVRFLAGDLKTSLEINQKAAALGSTAAQYWIGLLALDHQFGDLNAGLRALETAAGQGMVDAQLRLAVHLLGDQNSADSKQRAVALLEKAAEVENPTALMMLATCRRYGMGCKVDLAATDALLRRAVNASAPGAPEALAVWEAEPPPAAPSQTTDGTMWMRFGPEQPLQKGPSTMTVEVTTRCNLACVMCPHGLEKSSLIKRDAPDVLVDKVIKSLDKLSEVHPTGVGEPMLSDGFWRIVDALKDRPLPRLVFHTNGILLTDRNVERLARAPLSRVNISIDAADPLTYRRIRGADMRKTTDGVKRLVKAISMRDDRDQISIAISMVLMRENINEAAEFVRMAHGLGVKNVYFEHLTEPHMTKTEWVVNRDNFQFVYAEQELYDSPNMADDNILAAMDEADRLGVIIEGYQVLLGAENKVHENRPCRTGAFAPVVDSDVLSSEYGKIAKAMPISKKVGEARP